MRRLLNVLIITIILLSSYSTFAAEPEQIQMLMEKMTLEEKVGQLLLVGIRGHELTPQDKSLITNFHVGGVLYYPRNIESVNQLKRLSKELQITSMTSSKIPLWIATDHEGGVTSFFEGVLTEVPGNMLLGATDNPENAFTIGELVGKELSYIGVNLNLAPVVDVNNNPANPVIGFRSFGSNPERVGVFGVQYMLGLQESGILATAKHFPGHGDTTVDSHYGLPIVSHDLFHLHSVEIKPFKMMIANSLSVLMTAHIIFPALDPDNPATLSSAILTDLLRTELGYQGLVITDDLEMKAISEHYGVGRAAVKALQAGADMLLVGHTYSKQQEVYQNILLAVKSGIISKKRIDESVQRILAAKIQAGLFEKVNGEPEPVDFIKNFKIASSISALGVTLVNAEPGIIPLRKDQKYLLITVEKSSRYLVDEDFYQAFKDVGLSCITITLGKKDEFNREKLKGLIESVDTIIIGSDNLYRNLNQIALVQTVLNSGKTVILVALSRPYDLLAVPGVQTYLTLYGSTKTDLRNGIKILMGELNPTGILPVDLPDL